MRLLREYVLMIHAIYPTNYISDTLTNKISIVLFSVRILQVLKLNIRVTQVE